MRALVVYESMFGNTETVARAVAAGLSAHGAVELVEMSTAPTVVGADIDLVAVGGPTHALGMSRATTRADAATKSDHGVISEGPGMREWLESVRFERSGTAAVAFDTRVARPRVPGSAARAAQRRLRRLGCTTAVPAASFYVTGVEGPLVDAELDRAHRWGDALGAAHATRSRPTTGAAS